ncbi:MAG: B12-binding domain-containing radical SAM protein [Nitrospirae bacterium]|nr:B12-binding domain-containing radical SAM protein [Nitrospirota bacterium]MBF0533460.1 B12-binding domain-containing radical SAM protein [Nitrospirota bacterium]MBF0616016.1 B12-binding domain-containing radical SAM protein [Nitrospirota bacterium]
MKILAVSPDIGIGGGDFIFPVGLSYITAALKSAGHEVDCLVFKGKNGMMNLLNKNNYDFVATGGLSFQYHNIKDITNLAKENGKKIIAGGGIITSDPELMSRHLGVDYAVVGEGEDSVTELLSCLDNGMDLSNVLGLGYYKNGEFILNGRRRQRENLDSLPMPDYESFDFSHHLDSLRSSDSYYYNLYDFPREYPLVSSRSCPYSCTFCYHPLGDKYRQRSIDSIMQELKLMIPRYRINIVGIYDELFSYNSDRILEFCERFKDFTKTLSWDIKWGCQMRVESLDETVLKSMKQSGCFIISYGFESYSPVVLKSMKKHITQEQIHSAIHMTLDCGISIQGNFIFGDVKETLDTAKETLEFWRTHIEAGILLGFILPFPNSMLYRYCIEKGLIKDSVDFVKNHLFEIINMTQMDDNDFYRMSVLIYRYSWKYNKYVVPELIQKDSFIVCCPYCKERLEYKNFDTTRLFTTTWHIFCKNCKRRFYPLSSAYNIIRKLLLLFLYPWNYRLFVKLIKIHDRIKRFFL